MVLILISVAILTAQPGARKAAQRKNASPPSGTVSGRVFDLIKGKDFNPARLAKIYLLSWEGGENSAARQWNAAWIKAQEHFRNQLGEFPMTESSLCRSSLLTYDQATDAALAWAKPRKYGGIITSQTDQEGSFRITGIRPGTYYLIASGRAGPNDARWRQSIIVQAGSDLSIKMVSPTKACVVSE